MSGVLRAGAWAAMVVLASPASWAADGAPAGDFPPPTAEKRLHLKAARAEKPPLIDGVLDDEVWAHAMVATGFVEVEPEQGRTAPHQSVVKIAWDDDALYVSARLEQPGGLTAFNQRDLRRDFHANESDLFAVVLDPLGDGRNALSFILNPWGAQRDVQVLEDQLYEDNWDTVWSSATTRDDAGWTLEMAIPWKSIRYGPRGTQWHVQFFRRERGVNVDSTWSPFPRTVSPYRMPYAGVLDGLEPPAPRLLSLQLRPYVIARADRVGDGPIQVAPSGGGEVTWTPSSSTVVDLTVNTDFAETDVDHLVVNLSRFSVFYPERRQFFLESSGVFQSGFGGFLQPFFTRTIGVVDGDRVPISAGVRAVYRTLDSSAGALVINTLSTSAAQGSVFGVLRYSHNLGDESRLGGMLVLRHDLLKPGADPVTNVVPVVDGLFRLGPVTSTVTAMGSSTTTGAVTKFGGAATADATLQGNWGFFNLNGAWASPDFDARAGFMARPATFGVGTNGNLDFRPDWLPAWLRSISANLGTYSIWGSEHRDFQEYNVSVTPVWLAFKAGDDAWLSVSKSLSILTSGFQPVPRVQFAPGAYEFQTVDVGFASQGSRKFSAGFDVSAGGYYSATTMSASAHASLQPIPHVQVSASYSYNRFWGVGVTGEYADTHLLLIESRLALNPKLQLIGSYQRDTAGNASVLNARLAWEFLPLSFLYVVYTDTRSAFPSLDAPATEQRLVAKVAYTWRL
jgi:hypothetical protein